MKTNFQCIQLENYYVKAFVEEEFCCNLAIWQKGILTLDGLEKEQLIQLDDVTRIKLALRNQGQLAPFVCYLDFKIGNFAFDVTEIVLAKK